MTDFAKAYGITLVVFLALDAIWLGVVAPRFCQVQIGFLMTEHPRWLAAGAFYLLFVAGLVLSCRQGSAKGYWVKLCCEARSLGWLPLPTMI